MGAGQDREEGESRGGVRGVREPSLGHSSPTEMSQWGSWAASLLQARTLADGLPAPEQRCTKGLGSPGFKSLGFVSSPSAPHCPLCPALPTSAG